MRYWLLRSDGSGADGPYEPYELRSMPGFGLDRIIAPENARTVDAWKPARLYPDFRPLLAASPTQTGAVPAVPVNQHTSNVTDGRRPAADFEALLLLVPIVATALNWLCATRFKLPPGSLLLVVSMILTTAVIATIEARRVGMSANREKGTYSPGQWFMLFVGLWVVAYPAYLLKRRAYGLRNRIGAGLCSMLLFFGSTAYLSGASAIRGAHLANPTTAKPNVQNAESTPDDGQKAIDFVKGFPIRKAMFPRCPRNIEDLPAGIDDAGNAKNLADVATWPRVRTIEDYLDCQRLMGGFVRLAATTMAQASAGKFRGPDGLALQVRSSPDGWRRIFESQVTPSWTASHEDDRRFRVTLDLRKVGTNPLGKSFDKTERSAWAVDLDAKTLKPLTGAAWTAVAFADAAEWGAKADDLNGDVSGIAPIYSLPRIKKRAARPVVAKSKTKGQPSQRRVPTGPSHGPHDTAERSNDATKMSVDELQRYLNRGQR